MQKGTADAPAQQRPAAELSWSVPSALFLWLGLFVVYLSNIQVQSSLDNVTTALLPFSLIREHNLDLDEFVSFLGREGEGPSYVRERGGHAYSGNTVITPLLVAPLYVFADRWLVANQVPYDDVRAQLLIVVMERVAAALLTALSAALLWPVLGRLTTPPRALAITLVYALGSSTWVISSQGLWTHTFSELALVILSGVLLHPAPSALAMGIAGAVAAIAVANRMTMVLFALLAFVFVAHYRRRQLLAFLAVPIPAALALAAYNFGVFQRVAGGYGDVKFPTPLLEGLAGLLISPNRGLLVFMPIAIFAVMGAVRVWREPHPPWLRYLTVGIVVHFCFFAKFSGWDGGYTYGPRYITDILPAICLLLPFGLWPHVGRRVVASAAIACAGWGFVVQAIGVYGDSTDWNQNPVPLYRRPERVWDWSDTQIMRTAATGWHGGDLVPLFTEIVRGEPSARLAQLDGHGLASEVHAFAVPDRAVSRGVYPIEVEVLNHGQRSWPAFRLDERPQGRVFLLVRWLRDGMLVPGEGEVMPLPENVSPGERLQIPLQLVAPAQAGQFVLELSVAQATDGATGVTGEGTMQYPVTVQ